MPIYTSMTLIQPSQMGMKAYVDGAEPHALPLSCSCLIENGVTGHLRHVA